MFIEALGEVASADAADEVSDVAPIVLEPAAIPASDAVGALEALLAEELDAVALLLIVSL